eukprot:gene25100-10941_t
MVGKAAKKEGPRKRGCSVKDVDQAKFVKEFAAKLKQQGKIQVPKYADFVKTGLSKTYSPFDGDWFYTRC